MKNKDTIEMLKGALMAQPDNHKLRTHILQLMVEDGDVAGMDDVMSDDVDVISLGNSSLVVKPEMSLKLAEKALELDKANAHAYLLLAKAHRALGDAEQALKFYNIAAVIDESLEDAEFENAAGYGNSNRVILKFAFLPWFHTTGSPFRKRGWTKMILWKLTQH